jgi:cell division protein FtsI (penicillin-binding protein 3)
VHTGEVLALANYPTYNPNDRSKLTGEQLRNRVMTDTFEPGSSMKPFPVVMALDAKKVTPHTMIDTGNGAMVIADRVIHDTSPHHVIDVQTVIQKSSNIGTTKIAMAMPAQDLWEMFTKLGFGQPPKWGFPGAVAGRVRPYKSWRPIEHANMSFGQGMSVSLIQLARAYLVLARDGDIIPLSFQKVHEAPHGTQVISPKTAAEMREMLEMVTLPGGSAVKAQVPGYRVGGKTGTAQKFIGGRYSHTKYIGNFVGMAPMSDPRFIIAVMIDEPSGPLKYGGDVAGPVFSALAAQALRAKNVAPDSDLTHIIIPESAAQGNM